MKKIVLLFLPFSLFAMPLKWDCNFPEAAAKTFSVYQGETVTFEPTFRVNGKTVDLDIEGIYYQTNGMAESWWKLDGNTFAPRNDCGATAYRFFVSASGEGGKNYRANGTLRMLPSPGFVPNQVELPIHSLDFSQVEIINAPWPTTAAEIGAFPASAGARLQSQVAAQGAYLNAEDARFISTNYDSEVHIPEAEFEIKRPDGSWIKIWQEMTRWNWFLGGPFAAVTNSLSTKGEKEWGFYDAATGEPAPDGYVWLSMPRVAICAGAAYQRVATSAGSYWVLESNGLVANINGTTNGFFRIEDEEGNAQFEVIKGDKRTVFAEPNSHVVTQMDIDHIFTSYEISNTTEPPIAYFTRSLKDTKWIAESDSACPFNVRWTRKGSIWTCEWWPKTLEPCGFMHAAFTIGGETIIRNSAPVEMPRIIIDGVTYSVTVETIDGKKVLGLK